MVDIFVWGEGEVTDVWERGIMVKVGKKERQKLAAK